MTRAEIFTGPEVKAFLAGTKTQSRTPKGLERINERPDYWTVFRIDAGVCRFHKTGDSEIMMDARCPTPPGTIIRVRETCVLPVDETFHLVRDQKRVIYQADVDVSDLSGEERREICWTYAQAMPAWASRLSLEVLRVWVERVQGISADDAIDEGADMPFVSEEEGGLVETRRRIREIAFPALWDSRWAKRGAGWALDPWAWAREVRVVSSQGILDNSEAQA